MSALFELLNRASTILLDLDPEGREKLGTLEGKILCVNMTAPEITMFVQPSREGLAITRDIEGSPDVVLSGSLLSFARLGTSGTSSGVLSSGQILMQGDVDTGQAFQKILAQLDLDWEELVARFIGDTPARKTGNILRDLGQWARESAHLSRENLADYLVEEKRLLASPLAMERLENQVQQLRSDVDRIEQRMGRVKRLLEV